MDPRTQRTSLALGTLLAVPVLLLPQFAFAQASPFMTGATALQTNILAWLTPVAIILVMTRLLGRTSVGNY